MATYQWDISTPQSFASPSLEYPNEKKNKSPCLSCKNSHVKCKMIKHADGVEICERCIARGFKCELSPRRRDVLKQTVQSKNVLASLRLGLEFTTASVPNSELLLNAAQRTPISEPGQYNLPIVAHGSGNGLLEHGEPFTAKSPFSELTTADFDNDLRDMFSESSNPYSPTSTLFGSDQLDLYNKEFY